MNRLFFVGDSHCGWYRRAAQSIGRDDLLGGPLVSARLLQQHFFEIVNGNLKFVGQAAINFEKYKTANHIQDLRDHGRSLVVSLGLAAAPFYWHTMWRREYSISPEIHLQRIILSRNLIRQMVADLQASALSFYEYLFKYNLVYAVVPAPRPQIRHPIMKILGGAKVFELIAMYEEPIRAYLRSVDCKIVEPVDVLDHDGFLRKEYWADDPAHGNLRYGAKVIDALDMLRT